MASERKFVAENVRRVLLKEYLMKEVSRAGFGGLDVQRTPMGTSVILATERPGLVIGRRGATIKNLTMVIEERFGFENPQIEVHEVENANLNAQIMAEKLAFSLERGWHFRRAGHSSVRRIMESGAKGCHIIISGKLTGQRHRTEKFKDGYIKFCGEPKIQFMERGYAVAKLKQGIVGVTVEIMAPGARLPADIMVLNKTEAAEVLPDLIEKKAQSEAVPEAEAEAVMEEKPKKAPAKKAAKKEEPVADVPTEVPAAEAEVVEEKPKKAPAKKTAKKADAEIVAEEPAKEVEAPKKAPAKKAAAKKTEAEPEAEPEAAAEEKPKKAPAKKTAKKDEAEAEAVTEEKPKKAPAKKAAAKKTEAAAEEKPKKAAAKKKADKEEASE